MDFSAFASRKRPRVFCSEPEFACECTSGPGDFVTDHITGDTICTRCALVVEEKYIDQRGEWSTNGEDGTDNSRCGPPINPLLPDSSLTTMVWVPYKDRSKFRFMLKLHMQSGMGYKERSLYKIFKSLEDVMTNTMNLPKSIVENAKMFYADLKELKVTRGEVHRCLIGCAVFYACKSENKHGVTRSRKEIVDVFGLDVKHFNDALKFSRDLLQTKPYFHLIEDDITPSDLVLRTVKCIQFESSKQRWKVVQKIMELEKKMEDTEYLCGCQPKSILAGVLYAVLVKEGVPVDPQLICSNLNVSVITMTKIYNLICKFPGLDKVIQ
jgi:transcription initiation factor TFIIIB Brf1 subunit/transcription initiation factor TFIIB